MSKYLYAFIDAQWMICRAKSMQGKDWWVYSTDGVNFYWDKELTQDASDKDQYGIMLSTTDEEDGIPYYKIKSVVNANLLAKSVIQSIMKFKRDFDFMYPILCWDKSPYYKSEAIKEYKQDRYKPTESEIDQLNAQLSNPELTEHDRQVILNQIKEIELDISNFQAMQKAKYYIIFNLNNCGWKSVIKSGFEADDLAHLLAKRYNENPINDQESILLAIDKDWLHFQNDKVKFISAKYPDKDYSYITDPAKEAFEKYGIPNYDYGILSEIYGGSHNNVTGLGESIDWEEYLRRYWVEHDESMPNYADIDAYYNAMQIDKHESEVDKMLNFVLNENFIVDSGKMAAFCTANLINLNMVTYNQFINGLPINYTNHQYDLPPLFSWGKLTDEQIDAKVSGVEVQSELPINIPQ
jgi:hypothetical protein